MENLAETNDQSTKETSETENKVKPVLFDARATQRIAFEVRQDNEKYDAAHNLKPLSDERYLEFVRAVDISATAEDVAAQTKTAAESLWTDLIGEVENFELSEGEELKDAIEFGEKSQVLSVFLACVAVEPDKTTGKRKSVKSDRQTITTEMLFNGLPIAQTHVLQASSDEWRKKFDRIQRKRFKEEPTKGLRREPKFIYTSQDEAVGALYDEMLIESSGFAHDTPLRAKTTVVYYAFASTFDAKK